MGKKNKGGSDKNNKQKLTKKEKKALNHLKLVNGKGNQITDFGQDNKDKKKAS
jgi:hypothetical protein